MTTNGALVHERRGYYLLIGLTAATYPVGLGLTAFVLWLSWTFADIGFPFDFPLLALCVAGGHLAVCCLFAIGALVVRVPRGT